MEEEKGLKAFWVETGSRLAGGASEVPAWVEGLDSRGLSEWIRARGAQANR